MRRDAETRRGRSRAAGAGLLACLLSAGAASARAASSQHTVAEHECLWELSKTYYQDPYRWRDIAGANPQVKDPDLIYPGQVLVIPGRGAPQPTVQAEAAVPEPAPVETGAAVEASAPAAAAPAPVRQAEAPARAAEPEPEPAPAPPPPAGSDALSTEFPDGLAGQYPSLTRLRAPKGWKADGEITEFGEDEALAGPGDLAEAKMKGKAAVSVGQRLYVLRWGAPNEADEDQKASYLQRIAVVEVDSLLGKGRVRLRVIRGGGEVEAGDLLSREAL